MRISHDTHAGLRMCLEPGHTNASTNAVAHSSPLHAHTSCTPAFLQLSLNAAFLNQPLPLPRGPTISQGSRMPHMPHIAQRAPPYPPLTITGRPRPTLVGTPPGVQGLNSLQGLLLPKEETSGGITSTRTYCVIYSQSHMQCNPTAPTHHPPPPPPAGLLVVREPAAGVTGAVYSNESAGASGPLRRSQIPPHRNAVVPSKPPAAWQPHSAEPQQWGRTAIARASNAAKVSAEG